ncbi:MAG: hypothetical protein ABSE42_02865 [Bryobacteraceae bacterium]|jgi:hypothetical protein
MQVAAILFGALFTVATATALGTLLVGKACADWPVRFVAGSGVLSFLVLLLAASGLVYPTTFAILGVAAIVACQPWHRWRSGDGARNWPTASIKNILLFVIFIVYFYIYFLRAMAPEVSPDGATYHLGLTAQYLREHGFHTITWNYYASLSQGMEMLFLFAFAFGKHSAAALVHLAFLVALVWQMWIWGARHGMAWVGVCGAALVALSPMVGVDASSAYNDVALAAVAFTLFCLLENWAEDRTAGLLPVIGILAGFGYALKYTGWVCVAYAIGFVAWKSRRVRAVAVVAGFAFLLVAPWLLKNWMWMHNPLAPFFNSYFPNPYVTIYFEEDYKSYFQIYDLASRWQIPLAATVHGGLGGILGPVFLLAPLGLAALRKPLGRQLWLAALVFGANYFSNIGTRFLIPPLPFVALAMAMAFTALPGMALAVVVLHAALCWPPVVAKLLPTGYWRLAITPWRDAFHLRDPERYFDNHLALYPVSELVEKATPPGSSVLTFKAIPDAYTSRRILVDWESAANQVAVRIFQSAAIGTHAPNGRLRFTFPARRLRAIRVNQTASGPDVWSINELRIFSSGHELPREAGWRLTAHPFPWTIQDAFDNSPVTFWSSGEVIHPGMFVQVDCGGIREADQVVLEGPGDQYGVRLELEGETADGTWERLADRPVVSDGGPYLGFRRAAAEELKRRGIDYILCFQDEAWAEDVRSNRDLWGVKAVGAAGGATLYKLP